MTRTITLIPLIAAVTLAACASSFNRLQGDNERLSYADYAGEPIDHFTSFRLNGWTPVSRDQVVLWTGVNEAYLVRVQSTCPDLKFANSIGVTSTTRTISRFEKLQVGADTCPIEEIRPIDVKQYKADRRAQAEALKAARAAGKPAPEAPPKSEPKP